MSKISSWLVRNGLGKYKDQFESSDIDLDILQELTKDDLKELGLTLGHRKIFFKCVRDLFAEQSIAASNSSPNNSPTSLSEYRQLTVMFCDLANSTWIVNRIGAEAMQDLIREYQEICSQAVDRYNGFIASYLGDGIVVYFGYPQAHEQDADRSIKASLLLLELMASLSKQYQRQLGIELHIRIGIATGPVVVGDIIGEGSAMQTAVVGETPNLAARIQSVAPLNSVAVSDLTHRLAIHSFDYGDFGSHQVKGISNPIRVWQVTGERSQKGQAEATLKSLSSEMVGRQKELGTLIACWNSVSRGEGQLINLNGEAGIGKSQLVEKFLQSVITPDSQCLRLQCSPYHTGSVLFPMLDSLEQTIKSNSLLGEEPLNAVKEYFATASRNRIEAVLYFCHLLSIPGELDTAFDDVAPQSLQQLAFTAWIEVLAHRSEQSPMIMVVEDAHWLDATSMELLTMLIQKLHDYPILLIISSRPDFVSPWTQQLCATQMINLVRLERSHGREIINRITDGLTMPDRLVNLILEKTDGVPLFVEEFTKTILTTIDLEKINTQDDIEAAIQSLEVPETLNDLLMSRLDKEPNIKSVAQIGATIGRDFDYCLLSSVAPQEESELQVLLNAVVEADVAFETGTLPTTIYTFRHALLQDAAYRSMLKKNRRILHGQIASTMQTSTTGKFSSEIVAHHWTEAEQPHKAVPYWHTAARDAARVWANQDAVKRYKNALVCFNQAADEISEPIELELDLLLELGDALRATQGSSAVEAIEVFEKAMNCCRHTKNFDYHVRAYYGSFTTNFMATRLTDASTAAETLLSNASRHNHSAGLAAAYQGLGMCAFATGHFSLAQQQFTRALNYRKSIEFEHDLQFPVLSQSYLAWTLYLVGEKAAAHDLINTAMIEAQSVSAYNQALIMANACYLHQFEFEIEALAALTQKLKQFCVEKGFPVWHAVADFFDCWQNCHRAANPESIRKLLEALEYWSEDEIETPYFRAIVAQTLFQTDQHQTGHELAKNTRELMDRTGEVWFADSLDGILAQYSPP